MIEQYSWRIVAEQYLDIYYRSVNQKTVLFQQVKIMALLDAQDRYKGSTPDEYDEVPL